MKLMSQEPLRILFVCVENACRSQMAEAFARHYGGECVQVYSAGSRPRGQVDHATIAIMREKGLDLGTHTSKGLTDLPHVTWDAIVTMGCGDVCPHVPAKQHFDWQIPNPSPPLDNYRRIRDLIEESVKNLLEQLVRAV